MASSKLRRFKKARKNGTLPGPGKGRPPGVPWTKPKKNGGGRSYRSNPPLLRDIAEQALPGFGGFAATRIMTRVATSVAGKRWPRLAKHLGVLAGVGTFFAGWFLAHRIKKLALFHTPIVVGSGIAVLQTAIQTYIPQYGWLVGHTSEDPVLNDNQPLLPSADPMMADVVDDSNREYQYESGYDAPQQSPQQAQQQAAAAAASNSATEDLLADIEEDNLAYGSIFN